MQQAHFIQKLYNKYYPRKADKNLILLDSNWNTEEKEKLAEKYLLEGELLLAKKNLNAIEYFKAASKLNPESEKIWLRQGKAFFSYGKIKKQEKALYLANKNFKIAISFNEKNYETWWEWGKSLALLGTKLADVQYLYEAQKKYEKAIKLINKEQKEVIAKLYWEYANLWITISNESQEAGDTRLAIQAFKMSFAHQTKISAEFWCDYGKAFLQMGLFINDNRLYLEAIDYFHKALRSSKTHLDTWNCLAHTYTELYINTMDETCFKKAHFAYNEYIKLSSNDDEILLQWAQLLGESGKLTKDIRKLKLSYKKCIEAHHLNKKDPCIIGQWVESLSLLGAYTNNLDLITEAENKIIDAVQKHPKIPELWYSYGICMQAFSLYYNDLEYDEMAVEKFQIGLSIDRTNAELWHSLAKSYTKIGESNEDLECLQRASKFFLKAIDFKPSCAALTFDYGYCLLKLGELKEDQTILQEALVCLEATLNNQKDAILQHPDWLFAYGCVLDLLGDCHEEEDSYYTKALKAFNNVLLIDPDYPKLHFHIGLCYTHLGELSFDINFFHQAINSFKFALRQNEEDDKVYLEWGLALISLANHYQGLKSSAPYYQEAEKKILKAGQLGNQHAYYHLACLYSILYRFEECLLFLKKAEQQKILPSTEELLEDEWLENIRITKVFCDFIQTVENKQNMVDGL